MSSSLGPLNIHNLQNVINKATSDFKKATTYHKPTKPYVVHAASGSYAEKLLGYKRTSNAKGLKKRRTRKMHTHKKRRTHKKY